MAYYKNKITIFAERIQKAGNYVRKRDELIQIFFRTRTQ